MLSSGISASTEASLYNISGSIFICDVIEDEFTIGPVRSLVVRPWGRIVSVLSNEGETDGVLRNSASYSEERERLWVERNHLRELAGGTFIGHFNDRETAGAPLPMVRGGIFM